MDFFANPDVDFITKLTQFTPTIHRGVYPAISPKKETNSAKGKNVLITGATRGIGKGIATTWAEAGASGIVITGRTKHLLEKVANEIKRISPETKVVALVGSATSESDTKSIWEQSKKELGVIDVLVANAGLHVEEEYPKTGTIDPAKWWEGVETNIRGPYLHVYNFLQQFLSEGKEPTGTVIFISSAAGGIIIPGGSAYGISKLANTRQAEFLHAEHDSVRSFAVHPGLVPTLMGKDKATGHMYIDTPELTGAYTLYLSTPRADFLRGRFTIVNWDVEEMEKHADEIQKKGLLKSTFIEAKLGPGGHPFETAV